MGSEQLESMGACDDTDVIGIYLRTHVRISVLSYHIMTSRTVVSCLLYAITAQEEEGEWAQDKEEHNCQRNGTASCFSFRVGDIHTSADVTVRIDWQVA